MSEVPSVTLAEVVVHGGEVVHETLRAGHRSRDHADLVVDGQEHHPRARGDRRPRGPARPRRAGGGGRVGQDERRAITLRQLLHMTSGLRFVEDYVDDSSRTASTCSSGPARPTSLRTPRPCHSSTRLIPSSTTRPARPTSSAGSSARPWAGEARDAGVHGAELFGPLGMTSADPRFDAAGTFIGSSFLYCTARDFARFGQLYLGDGVWEGRRILPEGWVDFARTPAPAPVDEEFGYGAHWWLWDRHGFPGTFAAHGYEGPVHHRAARPGPRGGPPGQDADRGPAAGHRAPAGAARRPGEAHSGTGWLASVVAVARAGGGPGAGGG